MSSIDSIAVNIEPITGNVQPLLHEIRHALKRLADGGSDTIIDLRSMPLAPGEEQQLEAALGRGEISAELHTSTKSSIQEASFPGVWLISHYNLDDEVISKFIEVTHCPDLLKTPQEDVAFGLARLDECLADDSE